MSMPCRVCCVFLIIIVFDQLIFGKIIAKRRRFKNVWRREGRGKKGSAKGRLMKKGKGEKAERKERVKPPPCFGLLEMPV